MRLLVSSCPAVRLFVRPYPCIGAPHIGQIFAKLDIGYFYENLSRILLSTTNKMQLSIVFFITVYALHVSGGFSAHHHELKNCIHSIWYVPGLLAATASVVELELSFNSTTLAVAASKSGTYQMLCVHDGRRNRPKHVEHRQ